MERCLFDTKDGLLVRPCNFFSEIWPSYVWKYRCTKIRDGKSYCYDFMDMDSEPITIRSTLPDDPEESRDTVVAYYEGTRMFLSRSEAQNDNCRIDDVYLCVTGGLGDVMKTRCYDLSLKKDSNVSRECI